MRATGQGLLSPPVSGYPRPMKIVRLEARPLSIPLVEPFVIASGRVGSTRAALGTARIGDETTGRMARGIGEAAALPPVTSADQGDVLQHLRRASASLA